MGDVTTITGDSGTVLLEGVRYGSRSNTGVVTGEDVTYKNKVTSNPVETGSNVNDHVLIENNSFSITAIVIDGSMRDVLLAMRDNRDLLKYRGIVAFDDIVFTSLKMTPNSQNETGFSLSANFQKIEFVSAQKVALLSSMSKSDAETNKSDSAKRGASSSKNKGMQSTLPTNASTSSYLSMVEKKVNEKGG